MTMIVRPPATYKFYRNRKGVFAVCVLCIVFDDRFKTFKKREFVAGEYL